MVLSILDINTYNFTENDHLFFDTNIWFLLVSTFYSPLDPRVAAYSAAFRRIKTANAKIYIDVLVLSEYVNRYARNEHKRANTGLEFKDYRKSVYFKPVAQKIAITMRSLTKNCISLDTGFSKINHGELCTQFESGNYDFNDQLIAELCKSNKLTIVTDDSDYRGTDGITVLTANPNLLGITS